MGSLGQVVSLKKFSHHTLYKVLFNLKLEKCNKCLNWDLWPILTIFLSGVLFVLFFEVFPSVLSIIWGLLCPTFLKADTLSPGTHSPLFFQVSVLVKITFDVKLDIDTAFDFAVGLALVNSAVVVANFSYYQRPDAVIL